jgi:hypothetical protein
MVKRIHITEEDIKTHLLVSDLVVKLYGILCKYKLNIVQIANFCITIHEFGKTHKIKHSTLKSKQRTLLFPCEIFASSQSLHLYTSVNTDLIPAPLQLPCHTSGSACSPFEADFFLVGLQL